MKEEEEEEKKEKRGKSQGGEKRRVKLRKERSNEVDFVGVYEVKC